MKITIIGTGYVGLVTGACLADWGNDVVCVDKDDNKIDCIERGIMPIYEPGLPELVAKNREAGRLRFTTGAKSAVCHADAVFIAVGTPPIPNTGRTDLSFIHTAAREIRKSIKKGCVVIVKSTVPVGTSAVVESIIAEHRSLATFSVASNPEFLRQGSAIEDFRNPDRVVIGTESATARNILLKLYADLVERNVPIVDTKRSTSELIKYASNAFLATKVSFINEMADLCEHIGCDVEDLAWGMGLDRRIGAGFLRAGPGYGGSCFPKDTLALLQTANDSGVELRIVAQTVAANEARKQKMSRKVSEALGGSVAKKTIAILGLAFKPETDDMREAPSISLIETFQKDGAVIRAFDPASMGQAAKKFENVFLAMDPYECASGADAVVIMTEWNCFRTLDLAKLKSVMTGNVVVDLRNVLDKRAAMQARLRLVQIGRTGQAVGSDLKPEVSGTRANSIYSELYPTVWK